MSETVRPWVPPGAFDLALFENLFADAVAAWQRRWVPGNMLQFKGLRPAPKAAFPDREDTFNHFCRDGTLSVDRTARMYLAAEIFGTDFEILKPASNEQHVIEMVVDDCLADLRRTLASVLNLDVSADAQTETLAADDNFQAEIKDRKGTGLLVLRVSRNLLLQRFVERLPATKGDTPLFSRWSALDNSVVRAGVCLGHCQISLAEMTELQSGDVVTLDRLLNDPADLTIEGQVVAEQIVALGQNDSALILKLNTNTH